MSYLQERKEKDCLNCGAIVHGRYCHICGQENKETRESFWSLIKHFIYDLVHFDGKFFHTIKYIFTKPGLVARQYAEGRRMSFIHPIRMYLFTSAIFFLVFFSFQITGSIQKENANLSQEDRQGAINIINEKLKNQPGDTALYSLKSKLLDTSQSVTNADIRLLLESKTISINNKKYRSLAEYDSIQNTFPSEKRDGWFSKTITRKAIQFNEKYKSNLEEGFKIFLEGFLHKLPYMLFLSLPFFALILKLLYLRRKNFYYSDHAIFTLYHYIFSFLLLLGVFAFLKLQSLLSWGFLDFLVSGLFIAWPVYLVIEMKNFYRQSWKKTILKTVLLLFLGFIVVLILFLLFLLLSIFQL